VEREKWERGSVIFWQRKGKRGFIKRPNQGKEKNTRRRYEKEKKKKKTLS